MLYLYCIRRRNREKTRTEHEVKNEELNYSILRPSPYYEANPEQVS